MVNQTSWKINIGCIKKGSDIISATEDLQFKTFDLRRTNRTYVTICRIGISESF